MTPLEKAKQKTAIRTCQSCGNMEIVNGVAYCKESGKLIHPMLLNGQTKCPHDVKGD